MEKKNNDEENPWLSLSIQLKSIQMSVIYTDNVRLHCKKIKNKNKIDVFKMIIVPPPPKKIKQTKVGLINSAIMIGTG